MVADPIIASQEAIAVVELASIATGIVVLDQMAKRVETEIVAARTLSPGRYVIMVTAALAEVEEAMAAATMAAGDDLVDSVTLRDPPQDLRDALAGRLEVSSAESMLIVETTTISSTLLFLDQALKETDTRPLELRLGAGLSGKGVITLTGPLHMAEAAEDLVQTVLSANQLVRKALIAQPHPDLPRALLDAEPTAARGPS